ncbi:hypothetical protein ACFLRW_06610 [Acidobacteriota bacterium]
MYSNKQGFQFPFADYCRSLLIDSIIYGLICFLLLLIAAYIQLLPPALSEIQKLPAGTVNPLK